MEDSILGRKTQQSRDTFKRRENMANSKAWSSRLEKDVTNNKQDGFVRTLGIS